MALIYIYVGWIVLKLVLISRSCHCFGRFPGRRIDTCNRWPRCPCCGNIVVCSVDVAGSIVLRREDFVLDSKTGILVDRNSLDCHDNLFWILIRVFLILIYIGAKPVEAPFEGVGQILTVVYFSLYFIIGIICFSVCPLAKSTSKPSGQFLAKPFSAEAMYFKWPDCSIGSMFSIKNENQKKRTAARLVSNRSWVSISNGLNNIKNCHTEITIYFLKYKALPYKIKKKTKTW